jgi:membrane associated rhomboid family serine protease
MESGGDGSGAGVATHGPAYGTAPKLVRIPARSQRQAMDWSLVLASQEIHPVIAGPGTESAERSEDWGLLIEPEHYERARAAIRQYRLENRGWGWRTQLPGSAVEIHTGAVCWCLALIFWHWVVTFIAPGWSTAGEMSNLAVRAGEWHRLFTPILLHSDLAHLMANATFGMIFLGLAMARFGWGVTLLVTFLAGVLGNVMGYLLYDDRHRGLGASGMMMGALGLLCIQSFGLWRKNPKAARYILSGVIAGVLLFVLFGFSPGSDILAHLGGFVAGLFFGALLAMAPEERLQRKGLNLAGIGIVLGMVAVTWGFALQ